MCRPHDADYVVCDQTIENRLHWVLDATFHEDCTRQTLGLAGRAMASLNNLIIGLLRAAGFANLAHARRVCDGLSNYSTYLAIDQTPT